MSVGYDDADFSHTCTEIILAVIPIAIEELLPHPLVSLSIPMPLALRKDGEVRQQGGDRQGIDFLSNRRLQTTMTIIVLLFRFSLPSFTPHAHHISVPHLSAKFPHQASSLMSSAKKIAPPPHSPIDQSTPNEAPCVEAAPSELQHLFQQ